MALKVSCLVVLIALGTGCPPYRSSPLIYLVEDFEGCEHHCGWEIEGEAATVQTIHPAEHGLQLEAGSTGRRVVNPMAAEARGCDEELEVSLISTCFETSLSIEFEWTTSEGTEGQRIHLSPVCGEVEEYPGPDDLPSFTVLCSESITKPAEAVELGAVSVMSTSRCVIDQLLVFSPRSTGC